MTCVVVVSDALNEQFAVIEMALEVTQGRSLVSHFSTERECKIWTDRHINKA